MRRPPRHPDEPLFGGRTLALSLLQGIGVLLAGILLYGIALRHGVDEAGARALAFTLLVIANLALIFTNRSWQHSIAGSLRQPNRALWVVSGTTLAALALVLAWPPAQALFHFGNPGAAWLGVAAATGVATIAWFEVFKILRGRAAGKFSAG